MKENQNNSGTGRPIHGTMKMMPESERPYERMEKKGQSALSDAELLAVIIQSGTKKLTALEVARNILTESGGLAELANNDMRDFLKYEGIGRVKAMQLMAVYELCARLARSKVGKRFKIENIPQLAEMFIKEIGMLEQERFCLVILDKKWQIIKTVTVTVGTIDESLVHPREVFNVAIRYCASAIVLVHNHPSGDCEPSRVDIETTERLIRAGQIVGIGIVDHLIVGKSGYTSFYKRGIMDKLAKNVLKNRKPDNTI